MHSERQAQIEALLFGEAFTKVLAEYFNYSNMFSVENAAELLENTRMNKYAIKLEEDKKLPFRPIYNLRPIKLEILKTYIKTNLANGFI